MKSTIKNQVLLETKELSFHYGKKIILENVNFHVYPGEMVSIVGESGSGKSTLLYILGGFLKPQSGSYTFLGKKVYKTFLSHLGSFRRRHIGFLFQDFRLLPFLSVEQNIRFPVLFGGMELKRERLHALMESLGIFHRRKAFPSEISGGEMQRTGLGRALLSSPQLLLLDEPTGNLDEATEKEILSLLLKLKEDGISLVCVTHSSTIRKASDRVYRMKGHSLTEELPKAPRKKGVEYL